MQRQIMNDEINNSYRDYKRRAPELQQMYKSSMENWQKQVEESMKEKRTTLWELMTQVNIYVLNIFLYLLSTFNYNFFF